MGNATNRPSRGLSFMRLYRAMFRAGYANQPESISMRQLAGVACSAREVTSELAAHSPG